MLVEACGFAIEFAGVARGRETDLGISCGAWRFRCCGGINSFGVLGVDEAVVTGGSDTTMPDHAVTRR